MSAYPKKVPLACQGGVGEIPSAGRLMLGLSFL